LFLPSFDALFARLALQFFELAHPNVAEATPGEDRQLVAEQLIRSLRESGLEIQSATQS